MSEFENFGDTMLIKDRVYQALKTKIVMGDFAPGEKLRILDLANQMNISCAPVREALNMLNKDGLVELNPHKRPVVAEGTAEEYLVVVELRKMLEPFAAKYSIDKIPSERIEEVREQLNALLESPPDLVAYMDSDMAVHELLHAYSGSKMLSNILLAVKSYSMKFRYLFNEDEKDQEALKQHIHRSTREHLLILDALSSRDGDKAYETVLTHINHYAERNKPVSKD